MDQEGKTTPGVISRFSDSLPDLCCDHSWEPLAGCHVLLPSQPCAVLPPTLSPSPSGWAGHGNWGTSGLPNTNRHPLWSGTVTVIVTVRETEAQKDCEWPKPHNGSGQNQISNHVSRVGARGTMAVWMDRVPPGNPTQGYLSSSEDGAREVL